MQFPRTTLPVPGEPPQEDSTLSRSFEFEITLPSTTLFEDGFDCSPPKITPWPLPSITLPVICVCWACE